MMRSAMGMGKSLAVLGAVALCGGCLADEQRPRSDTSVGDTAADTGAGDTGTDVDAGGCGDCNDNDPCTFDQCGPDGQCQHLQAPGDAIGAAPRPECLDNNECDDLDPCTEDLCVADPGGCGYVTATCMHNPIVGCQARCDTVSDCDDQQPCTEDYCDVDGTCGHALVEDCEPGCTGAAVMPLSDVMASWSTLPNPVVTVGTVAPWTMDQACNDGPTCDCIGAPALWSQWMSVGLVDGLGGTEPVPVGSVPWTCETHGCAEVAVACAPLAEGVTYRVWGGITAGVAPAGAGAGGAGAGGGGDAIVPPQALQLVVAGYCLDTAPESLAGRYLATLELVAGLSLSMEVTMEAVDQGVIVTFGAPTCDLTTNTCPAWAMQGPIAATVLEEGDGQVGFEFAVPSPIGAMPAHVTLYSNRSQLVGRWGPSAFAPDGVAMGTGGRVILTRLGTGLGLGPIPL